MKVGDLVRHWKDKDCIGLVLAKSNHFNRNSVRWKVAWTKDTKPSFVWMPTHKLLKVIK